MFIKDLIDSAYYHANHQRVLYYVQKRWLYYIYFLFRQLILICSTKTIRSLNLFIKIVKLDIFCRKKRFLILSSVIATCHYVNFAMRWGTASKTASRRWAIPKRGSVLSGHWMGHLLSYSLSGGHDGVMLPINPRGLNGPLTSHFIFSSHMYFSLNTPTYYWYPMPNYNTPTLSGVMI